MTLTCYRCPRRLAWARNHRMRETIARAFGWIKLRDRFFCPECQKCQFR